MNITHEMLKEAMERGLHSNMHCYIEYWREKYCAELELENILAGRCGKDVIVYSVAISDNDLNNLDKLYTHTLTLKEFVDNNANKWESWYLERQTHEVDENGETTEEPFIVTVDTYDGFHVYGENWIIHAELKPEFQEMNLQIKVLRAKIEELDSLMEQHYNTIMSTLKSVESDMQKSK